MVSQNKALRLIHMKLAWIKPQLQSSMLDSLWVIELVVDSKLDIECQLRFALLLDFELKRVNVSAHITDICSL